MLHHRLLRVGNSKMWTPLELFQSGEQGAWYDPSDLATLFQDAAGTIPVTADGDPVGRMEDKSGNGNHATQSVSGRRPVYRTDGTLHWLEFDGVDDSLTINQTFTSDMDVALGLSRGDASSMLLMHSSTQKYLGVVRAGDTGRTENGAGNPEYRVNGNLVSPKTRGQLHIDVPPNTPKIIEIDGANMSLWTLVYIGGYSGYEVVGDIFGVVLVEGLSVGDATKLREYIANKL